MQIELAPMEGITTYIYRNALNRHYGGVDVYFTPFISTHKDKSLNFKEIKEIKPENNEVDILIPQVLTNNASEFLFTASQIKEYGYKHININFGCPSGTVTTKGKGAGALQDADSLEKLLDEIMSKTDIKISVKTRMGFSSASEWERLSQIYEKFPLEELIVHARIREDYYNGQARMGELAEYGFSDKIRFSYNGDIYIPSDMTKIQELFPDAFACMIGRGLIADPHLAANIKLTDIDNSTQSEKPDMKSIADELKVFKAFNHELIDKYNEIMPGEKNTLFKLKELWVYMIKPFEKKELTESDEYNDDSAYDFKEIPKTPHSKKLLKSIRKCSSLKEYERIIDSL